MKTRIFILAVVYPGLFGCAATVPQELSDAREAYRRASSGSAAQVAPAELHIAQKTLTEAEKAFRDNPDSYRVRDLAYVAQRQSQMAEVVASIASEKGRQKRSNSDYRATQSKINKDTKGELSRARETLSTERLLSEREARRNAEQQAADARAALEKLAAVKDEPRGRVLTLSGTLLFASNKSALLPAARSRLNQIAEVLLEDKDRNLTINGHTDGQGTDAYNMELSQRRADAVRSYLVGRGYGSEHIEAQGMGEASPIADNTSTEGRANNRRVEIVIANAETRKSNDNVR